MSEQETREFDEDIIFLIDNDEDSYRNMSAKEREIRMCRVLAEHGYMCSTKHGDGCGKSITQLIIEAEAIAKSKAEALGIKIKERKLPVITMDHVNGDSHQNDLLVEGDCGNLQPLCYSCNRKKAKKSQPKTDNMSREKRDSIDIENKFFKRLQIFLVAKHHICYKEMLAVGKKWADGVQITISRHFENELRTAANTTGKFRTFDFECKSELCNGKHVCFVGDIPQVVIEQKRNEYLIEWEQEFGQRMPDEEWKRKFGAAPRNEKYVTKEDYITIKVQEFLNKQKPS